MCVSANSSLLAVPEDVLAALLPLIDHGGLCDLRLTSKTFAATPAFVSEFHQRSCLVIPPDDERSHALLETITIARPNAAPRNILVQIPRTLAKLRPVSHHVLKITIREEWASLDEYASPHPGPEPPLVDFSCLSEFPRLVKLTVNLLARDHIDLKQLQRAAPLLERLCISELRSVRNTQELRVFQRLRVLKLNSAGTTTWDLADLVGMPQLEELYIESLGLDARILGAHHLADLRPLRVLCIAASWVGPPPNEALRVHLASLRKLHLRDKQSSPASLIAEGTCLEDVELEMDFDVVPHSPAPLGLLQTTLRKLFLRADVSPEGLEAVATLTSLESLKISLGDANTHCRPLCNLTNLKTLDLANGCVADFLEHLPHLRVLKWEGRDRLRGRSFEPPGGFWLENNNSSVRRVELRGSFSITPFACSVMRHIEELSIVSSCKRDWQLDWSIIGSLAKVKRLFLDEQRDLRVFSSLADQFRSLPILEELHVVYTGRGEHYELPPGIAEATRLRVFSTDAPFASVESLAGLRNLECLFLRGWRQFSLVPLLTLHKLREVALPYKCCCQPLREARKPGGALPALQRVFHPIGDCLVFLSCRREWTSSTTEIFRLVDHRPKWVVEM